MIIGVILLLVFTIKVFLYQYFKISTIKIAFRFQSSVGHSPLNTKSLDQRYRQNYEFKNATQGLVFALAVKKSRVVKKS